MSAKISKSNSLVSNGHSNTIGEGYFLVEEAGQRKIIKDPTNDDLKIFPYLSIG